MKCRINSKLDCRYQLKIGKGKWNLLLSCQDCAIFKASKQSMFSKTEEEECFRMSLEKLKDMQQKRMDLEKLPKEVNAVLMDFKFDQDRQGRDCLYINFQTEDGAMLTQKYSSMHIVELVDALEKLEVKHVKDLEGKRLHLSKVSFRIGNPRLVPTKIFE